MVPIGVPWAAVSPPPVFGEAKSSTRKENSLTDEVPCEGLVASCSVKGGAHGMDGDLSMPELPGSVPLPKGVALGARGGFRLSALFRGGGEVIPVE